MTDRMSDPESETPKNYVVLKNFGKSKVKNE